MFEELKKLLRQSVIYGIGSAVTPLIGFVMLPLYARYLTPAEYGILAITAVVTSVLSLLFSMGINSGIIRFYFAYSQKRDKDEVIVSSLLFSVVSAVPMMLLLWFFSDDISRVVFNFDKGTLYFRIIIFTAAMNTGIVNALAVLRAEERPVNYSVITVLRVILTLSLNIVFVALLHRNVQGVLEAGLVSAAITIVSVAAVVLRGRPPSMSWVKVKQVLRFGVPLVPGAIAALVLTLADRYFLKHFATMNDVGLYSVVAKIASVLQIVMIEPFRVAWPPYMLSVLHRSDAKEIYKKVLVYFAFASVWGGLVVAVFAKECLIILATPAYYSAYRLVPLLVISSILLGMSVVLSAGIHISKETKYASYSFAGAAVVTIIGNFLLVPHLGMTGAALTSVAAYLTLSILYYRASQRFYYIPHEFRRIVHIFAVGIAIYFLSVVVTRGMGLKMSVAVKLVCVLLYPVLLYFTRFFARNELAKVRELVQNARHKTHL